MKTSNYFSKRQEQRMKLAHDKATGAMRKINIAITRSRERLKSEIFDLTKKYEGLSPKDARKYLNQTVRTKPATNYLMLAKDVNDERVKRQLQKKARLAALEYRIKRKEAMLDILDTERLLRTDAELSITGNHLKNVLTSGLKEQGFIGINEHLVSEVLNHNWMGSNYSKRIWRNQKVLTEQLQTSLLESFISGKSNKQIADELENLTDMGRFAANRLIRTETSYIVNSADLISSKERGIKAKRFEATLDSRTSKVCRKHNQRIIRIEDIEIGVNAPPLHPFCRSFLSDLLEGWDYETDGELEKMIVDSNENFKYSNIINNFSPVIVNEEMYLNFAKDCNILCSFEEVKIINRHTKPDGSIGGYFQSARSFKINKALQSNDFSELDNDDINVINTLKSVIPRVETKQNYLLHRFDGKNCLNDFFSDSIEELAKNKKPINKNIKINKMLSTSMIEANNLFTNRPVKWEIKAPNGSNIFANGFIMESEALIAEGSEIRILNIYNKNGKIIIEALLI